ncbi:condensation domain-containing protein [Actinophytocola sp.]|uniref:condensation domain-containing protein n=1 Tax=Actinophytocola sp. TaxID=1872138 RepID=UPI002D7EC169|nr:condensation domain-containing protein [Actinophytocola sp.]HET9143152.1 condensation domain-containing protein [Actinophytocola sp.]
MQLSPRRAIPVAFTGSREAEGPLTVGQISFLGWLNPKPHEIFAVLGAELDVPDGVSVDDVAETVAVLVSRHETLRTSYDTGPRPRQRVAASGELPLDVCALGEGSWGPRDRPAVAEALLRWLRTQQPPYTTPAPVRVAVATGSGDDERVIACAAVFSHMAVDFAAIEIIRGEFAEMIRDPAARRVGQPRHQPLDQAALEATPDGRRQAEAALRYLHGQSMRLSRCLYAVPDARETAESVAVELLSVAAAMAVRQVAARTRASRSSVVLAAICAVLACRTGCRELVVPLMASNRFEPHLTDYVGPLAQLGLATVEVGRHSFDAVVAGTWRSVLEASRHARYDPGERAAMNERIEHRRGLRIEHDALFNSLVAESWSGVDAGAGCDPERVSAALRHTELRWRPVPPHGTPIRFSLNQIDSHLHLDLWSADTGLAPRAELESLLRAIERLLVAATDTDLDAEQIRHAIGLDPIARGPDWVLVDSCWVDLTEVQRLLDEALAPAVARIFATADGAPLVAYLTATDAIRTPDQAHARCMAALANHPTALTPRHYVICETAPPRPADRAAWRTIRTAGSGRA